MGVAVMGTKPRGHRNTPLIDRAFVYSLNPDGPRSVHCACAVRTLEVWSYPCGSDYCLQSCTSQEIGVSTGSSRED